jgi:hypothetical protein
MNGILFEALSKEMNGNDASTYIDNVLSHLPKVYCFYTPDGMTRQAWQHADAQFGMS